MKQRFIRVILSCALATALLLMHSRAAQAQAGAAAAPTCVPAQAAAPAAPAAQAGGQAGARGAGRGGGAATQPIPRDAAVMGIPGVVAAGSKWTKIWQGGGNSADGILSDKDGNALVAQEDFDSVLRIDKDGKTSVFVANAKGIGSLQLRR